MLLLPNRSGYDTIVMAHERTDNWWPIKTKVCEHINYERDFVFRTKTKKEENGEDKNTKTSAICGCCVTEPLESIC